MEERTYGYARVSSKDHNLDWQLDAFEAFGVAREMVFADKASGKDFERPEYRRLVEALCEGIAAAQARGVRFGRPPPKKRVAWAVSVFPQAHERVAQLVAQA